MSSSEAAQAASTDAGFDPLKRFPKRPDDVVEEAERLIEWGDRNDIDTTDLQDALDQLTDHIGAKPDRADFDDKEEWSDENRAWKDDLAP